MTNDRLIAHAVGFATLATLATLTTVSLGQGGDDPGRCTSITLGVTDSGTTAGYSNFSDEDCPYSGSTSPDVYYCYTPSTTHGLTVELCQSSYDTKTYVYDSSLELLTDINGNSSCNDDACSSSGGGLNRSLLHCVPVSANAQYFVVVDGWGGESGEYSITLHDTEVFRGDPDACAELPPCIFDPCDPAYTPEGEACNEGEDDCYNGGCNCTGGDPLQAFSPISCGETICGSGYFNGTLRDTDWFRIDSETVGTYTWDVIAEFECVMGRIITSGFHDCSGITAFGEFDIGATGCVPLQTVSPEISAGTQWFFVGANFTATVLCSVPQEEPGIDYLATLSCVFPPPPCPWDLNENQEVDFQDLLAILANWGPCAGVLDETGACCLPDFTCIVGTPLDCFGQGGDYQGADTVCGGCPKPVGACCLPDQTCDILLERACLSQGGSFFGVGTVCDVDCTEGGCCVPNIGCVVSTPALCDLAGGEYQGDGTTCRGIQCP